MLRREANGSGWQVTLRAQGALRFLPAAFLCAWLCGWLIGEYLALSLLGSTLKGAFGARFLAGVLPALPGGPVSREALPIFLTFLGVWIPLWTLGGYGALSRLLSLLFGREVIRWNGEGLEVTRSALFSASAVRLAPHDVTGFRIQGPCLMAGTHRRSVVIAQLGSIAEREELLTTLDAWRQTLTPSSPPDARQSPAHGWEVTRDEAGAEVLAAQPGPQRAIGGIVAAMGAAFAGSAAAVSAQSHSWPFVAGAVALAFPAAVCLVAAAWLLAVRESWLPRSGVLERRRTAFGHVWSHELSPLRLEIRAFPLTDGAARYTLVASGGDGDELLASSLGDPNPPMALGRWLAQRTGVELSRRGQESDVRKAG